jgi:hypothetical protein
LQDTGRTQYVADFDESDDDDAIEDGNGQHTSWSPPDTDEEDGEQQDGEGLQEDGDSTDSDEPSTSARALKKKASKPGKKTRKDEKKSKKRPRIEIEYETEQQATTRGKQRVRHTHD